MSEIKFPAKMWKQGGSLIVTIPAKFVEHYELSKGDKCEVILVNIMRKVR